MVVDQYCINPPYTANDIVPLYSEYQQDFLQRLTKIVRILAPLFLTFKFSINAFQIQGERRKLGIQDSMRESSAKISSQIFKEKEILWYSTYNLIPILLDLENKRTLI